MIMAFFESKAKHRKTAVWITGSVLVVFFGLRGFVQTDWVVYYWLYVELPSLFDGIFFVKSKETGFLIYAQLFKTLGFDYYSWVFLSTVIDVVAFTIIFRRYSSSIVLSWLFFISFGGLGIEMNLMRNVKAIILILLALPYIQQHQFWKFFAVWLAAMLFHVSAFFYLPAYFLLNRNWGRVWPLMLFIVVNIIFFFKLYPATYIMHNVLGISNEFLAKAFNYVDTSTGEVGLTFGYVERFLMFVLVYTLYGRLIRQNSANLMFCNAYYIFYTLWYLFSDVPVFVERMPILFVFSYWILGPNMMRLAKGVEKRIVNILVAVFVLMKITTVTDHILYGYDNLLTGIKPKEVRVNEIKRYEASTKR